MTLSRHKSDHAIQQLRILQESSLMGGYGRCVEKCDLSPLQISIQLPTRLWSPSGGCQPPFGWWGRWGNEARSNPVGSPSCLGFVEDDGEGDGVNRLTHGITVCSSFVKATPMVWLPFVLCWKVNAGKCSIHAAFGTHDFFTERDLYNLYMFLQFCMFHDFPSVLWTWDPNSWQLTTINPLLFRDECMFPLRGWRLNNLKRCVTGITVLCGIIQVRCWGGT